MYDVRTLRRFQLHAAHSHIVESACKQPDQRLGNLLLRRFPTARHLRDELAADTVRTSVIVDHADGTVYVRFTMLGEDNEWHGLTHPPAYTLGIDPDALKAAAEEGETALKVDMVARIDAVLDERHRDD